MALKEVRFEDIPEKGTIGQRTELYFWGEQMARDFMDGGYRTVEVTDIPVHIMTEKQSRTKSLQITSAQAAVRAGFKRIRVDNVEVVVRSGRLFIVKTSIRHMV